MPKLEEYWSEAPKLVNYPYFLRLSRAGKTYCKGLDVLNRVYIRNHLIWFRDNIGFAGIEEIELCEYNVPGYIDSWYVEHINTL